MKKQFLLGLMAMLLPLAAWAQGQTDEPLVANTFSVSFTGTDATNVTQGEFDYKGVVSVEVAVKYNTLSNGQVTPEDLTKDAENGYTATWTYKETANSTGTTITDLTNGIKDAGIYTVTVSGTGVYRSVAEVTKTFTITKKALTLTESIKKDEEVTKQYGVAAEDLVLSELIKLTQTDNGLVADTDDEQEDALKCLALEKLYDGGAVGGKVLFNVIAATNSESKNYTYTTPRIPISVVVDITEKELTLAWDTDKGSSEYNGNPVNLDNLKGDITGLIKVKASEEAGEDDVDLLLSWKDETEVTNAGEYTINVTLTGTKAENYKIVSGSELTYTVDRKALTIVKKKEGEMTKVYNGQVLTEDDVKDYLGIKDTDWVGNDAETYKITFAPSKASKDYKNAGQKVLIQPYLNGNQINTGAFGEPEGLDNYKLVDLPAGETRSITITKRPVSYYFVGTLKDYAAENLATTSLTTPQDYTVEIVEAAEGEESGLLDGDNFTEGKEPKAVFVDTEVRNVKTEGYALKASESEIGISSEDGTDVTSNYNITIADDVEDVTYLNSIMIKKGTATITMKDQEIEFNDFNNEEKLAEKLIEWATSNYSGMSNTPSNRDDRLAIRDLVKVSVGEDIVDDEATGEEKANVSGKKELIVSVEEPDAPEEGEQASKAWIAYNNYDIHCVPGVLTIKAVELEDGLVLNASEDFVTEDEGTEDEGTDEEEAEDSTEPVAKVADLLKQYNGATVNKVQVMNLINNVGFVGEDGKYKYTEANHTFEAGKWYTLVLPFDVELGELSQQLGYGVFYLPNPEKTKVAADSWGDIYFKMTFDDIPANTMVLFRVNGSKDISSEGLTFTNKKIVALTEDETENGIEINDGISYVPVYAKKTLNGTDYTEWFMYTEESQFVSVSALIAYNIAEELNVYPFNAYVTTPVPNGYGTATARFFVEEADGTTTQIDAITGEVISNITDGWYTIGGMKLNAQPTQKGVYINNGQKVVIK